MHYIKHILITLFLLCTVLTAQGEDIIPFRVKASLNHDISAYTQGLFIHEGVMYESTGQYGESSLRKVDRATGKVLQLIPFDRRFFAEGACVLDGRIYVLTWRERLCFVYDLKTMMKIGELRNPHEGWGLTTDGKELIMSDGTSSLYFLDPYTFMEKRRVTVTSRSREVAYINELEYIDGKVWANIYGSDHVVVIDPLTGKIEARMDCSNLLPANLRTRNTDVLNGIAYDEVEKCLYLTGKYWPRMYKIETDYLK